jgi:hypothetical protein
MRDGGGANFASKLAVTNDIKERVVAMRLEPVEQQVLVVAGASSGAVLIDL